jgi:hypothetical protein
MAEAVSVPVNAGVGIPNSRLARVVLGSLGTQSKAYLRKHPFFSQAIHIFKPNSSAKSAFFALFIANQF